MNSNHRAEGALARALHVAARMKPVVRSTGAAAKQGVRTTRAWAAPELERTGHLVQDRIAPGISSVLSSAARRIEPAKPRHRRWRKMAGASVVTAGIGAVAGAVFKRRRQNGTAQEGDADSYPEATAWNGRVDAEAGAEGGEESRSTSD